MTKRTPREERIFNLKTAIHVLEWLQKRKPTPQIETLLKRQRDELAQFRADPTRQPETHDVC